MKLPPKLKPKIEEALLKAMEGLGEGLFVLEGQRFIFSNEAFSTLCGYSPDEISLLPAFRDLFPETDQGHLFETLAQAETSSGAPRQRVTKLRQKNGNLKTVGLNLTSVKEGEGSQWLGVVMDLTEFMFLRETLEGGENQYQQFFQKNPSPIFIYHLESLAILDVNESAIQKYGYTLPEFLKMTLKNIRPPEDAAEVVKKVGLLKFTHEVVRETLRHRTKDGSILEVEVLSHPISFKGVPARALMVTDFTQLKKTQADLRASRERLQAIVTSAPLILFALDENGNFTLSEGSGLKALNLVPGQVIGTSALELYRETPALIRDLRRALKGERFTATAQVAGLWFETQYVPITDEKGQLKGVTGVAVDVTDRKKMEEALRQRMDFEKLITTLSSQFINLPWEKIDQGIQNSLDSIGRFIGADRAFLFLTQGDQVDRPAYQWTASKSSLGDDWKPDTFLSNFPWFSEKIRRNEVVHIDDPGDLPPEAGPERRLILSRGVTSLVVVPVVSAGRPIGLLTFSTIQATRRWSPEDIALFKIAGEMLTSALERKNAEVALRGSEDKFRELFNNANDPILIYSFSPEGVVGKFVEVNDLACQKTGFSREELLQMTPYDLSAPEDIGDMPKLFRKLFEMGHVSYEKAHLSKEGQKVPFEVNSHIFTWNGQKMAQAIARDVSDRKKAEETIRRQAYYDILTALPNRTLFKDRLEQAMKTAHRNQQALCVMVLDLDRFKTINETLGHQIGDKLLMGVADRLLGILADNGTIARFGGDEFTLLLPQVNQAEEATHHAQRIIETLASPFKLDGHDLHITTSIGMAFYPADGENPEVLLKNAETAMYRAKEQGRNNYQLYASVMNVSAFKQLLMENSLRRALEKQEFVVYLQPQIDLFTKRMIGAEALVRWQHPDLGLVFPTEFIGLAEETGLIVPMGDWVLERVCKLGRQWKDKHLPKLCVSVNLSARQFQQRNLVNRIAQILDQTGLDADCLGLEITESIAMKNADFTISALNELKKMGIHLSLDDFGTGYSSLSYLKRFPLETLKIDRSFVRDITTDPNDAAIVQAVIALAHSLKLNVVAEGVETEGQLSYLKSHGCDQVQGYYFSHPLSEENFLNVLKEFPPISDLRPPPPSGHDPGRNRL